MENKNAINIYNAIQNLYNMDNVTWQQVLALMYNTVSDIDGKFDIIETKFGIELPKEVKYVLSEMVADGTITSLIQGIVDTDVPILTSEKIAELVTDGTLASMINEQLLTEINSRVNELNNVLTTTNKNLQAVDKQSKDNATNIQTINKYQEGSNIDFENKEHDSLNARLIADYIMMMDRFNQAKLLPYESGFISASNTYEGKTRELVVKGRTLQNLLNNLNNITHTANSMASSYVERNIIPNAKSNTKYTLILSVSKNSLNETFRIASSDTSVFQPLILFNGGETGTKKFLLTSNESINNNKFIFGTNKGSGEITFTAILLEGDYTNKPIPSYFEGIKSVNEDGENLEEISCGKNLLNENLPVITVSEGVSYKKLENGFEVTSSSNSVRYCKIGIDISIDKLLGKTVICSCDSEQSSMGGAVQLVFRALDDTDKYVPFTKAGFKYTFPDKIKGNVLLGIYPNNTSTPNIANTIKAFNIQMEIASKEQSTPTFYDIYKEYKIPINMKNLRSLPNGTCDTSDGVRKVGKNVLNGSENWTTTLLPTDQNTMMFTLPSILDCVLKQNNSNVISDRLPNEYVYSLDREGIFISRGSVDTKGNIYVRILKTKLATQDVQGFKNWLKTNTTTVYYELATPTTEEGNIEELRTYDGTTNIFTEGSLINPNISCKIPSNVQQVVMSLKAENNSLNNELDTLAINTREYTLANIETNVEQECRITMLEMGVI